MIVYKTTTIKGQDLGRVLTRILVKHPVCSQDAPPLPLDDVIIQLNDTFGWSREAIADWIDTLDEQPTFYPSIPIDPGLPKTGSTEYTRSPAPNPPRQVIIFTCGCVVKSDVLYCGPCKAGGKITNVRHACYECTNDDTYSIGPNSSIPF